MKGHKMVSMLDEERDRKVAYAWLGAAGLGIWLGSWLVAITIQFGSAL